MEFTMSRLPVLFVSHGAPTFALEPGHAGALLARVGERWPKPRAVLVMSPHWMTPTPLIGLAQKPETIHDFGGFPAPLYALQYPASGSREVALEAVRLLQADGVSVGFDEQRGLDHGAWVPLMHTYPLADVPVVPISLPTSLSPQAIWEMGEALAPLADEGVLIVGSGSLTHNLYEVRMQATHEEPHAVAFVHWARQALQGRDRVALTGFMTHAPDARRAHPTPDHYLPLLFAAGAARDHSELEVLEGGMRFGVLSMESYLFKAADAVATA